MKTKKKKVKKSWWLCARNFDTLFHAIDICECDYGGGSDFLAPYESRMLKQLEIAKKKLFRMRREWLEE